MYTFTTRVRPTLNRPTCYSCSRIVRAQRHVESEHHRRQARPTVVVVGELGVRLYLFHTLRSPDDHVPVHARHYRAKVEVHRAQTTAEHVDRHGKAVRLVALFEHDFRGSHNQARSQDFFLKRVVFILRFFFVIFKAFQIHPTL